MRLVGIVPIVLTVPAESVAGAGMLKAGENDNVPQGEIKCGCISWVTWAILTP
jgi:hypothetical protein